MRAFRRVYPAAVRNESRPCQSVFRACQLCSTEADWLCWGKLAVEHLTQKVEAYSGTGKSQVKMRQPGYSHPGTGHACRSLVGHYLLCDRFLACRVTERHNECSGFFTAQTWQFREALPSVLPLSALQLLSLFFPVVIVVVALIAGRGLIFFLFGNTKPLENVEGLT